MAETVDVVLVGIGGYGEAYVSALLDEAQGQRCKIVGAVDPEPERCSRLADIEAVGIPTFASLEKFYERSTADLAVISSPIHYHTQHVLQALTNGSHVLVEKPVAAVPTDVDKMIEARNATGKFVAVGYQWSFTGAVIQLKKDILAGVFGTPIRGKCLTLWPRTESYYNRNDWAGKERDAEGRWILDSPANNAMAHYLHNMLFLFGSDMDRSAEPVSVEARLARANDIETFDTAAARFQTDGGIETLFIASHAIAEQESVEPCFSLEFEEATVDFPGEMAPITVSFEDGRRDEYRSPNETRHTQKLWACVNAVIGQGQIPCGLEAARAHSRCVELLHQAAGPVTCFPEVSVRRTDTLGGPLRWVEGLAKSLADGYAQGEMPRLPGLSSIM
jgi:predicted dehydrogenase